MMLYKLNPKTLTEKIAALEFQEGSLQYYAAKEIDKFYTTVTDFLHTLDTLALFSPLTPKLREMLLTELLEEYIIPVIMCKRPEHVSQEAYEDEKKAIAARLIQKYNKGGPYV